MLNFRKSLRTYEMNDPLMSFTEKGTEKEKTMNGTADLLVTNFNITST